MAKKKTKKSNDFLTAVALIVIGALFVIYKGGIISIAMSLIGITLIVLGIIDIIRTQRIRVLCVYFPPDVLT